MKARQTGLTGIQILIILAILAIAGFIVFRSYQAGLPTEQSSTTVPNVPEVKTASDLGKAEQALDQTNLDSDADSAALDSELSAF